MEGPPQNHDMGRAQLLQAGRQQVQFAQPARVGWVVGVQQAGQIHAFVAQAAAVGVGRIVEMGADGDQAALVPIRQGGLIRPGCFQSAPAQIRVVHPQDGGPVPCFFINIGQRAQIGALAEIGELPGDNAPFRGGGKALEILQHRPRGGIGARVGGVGVGAGISGAGKKREAQGQRLDFARAKFFASAQLVKQAMPPAGIKAWVHAGISFS